MGEARGPGRTRGRGARHGESGSAWRREAATEREWREGPWVRRQQAPKHGGRSDGRGGSRERWRGRGRARSFGRALDDGRGERGERGWEGLTGG